MAAVALLALLAASSLGALVDHVDPFIGTGGQGFGAASVPPGAQLPFSSVRLSPDTAHSDVPYTPFDHFGGYHFQDDEIRVFSHLHTQGAGDLDLGILSVLPVGQVPAKAEFVTNYGYRSRFSHATESASPGYYRVELETHRVVAELTTGQHFTGTHRYTWSGEQRVLLFPISHAMPQEGCKLAGLNISVATQEVTGFIWHEGSFGRRGGGVRPFLVARFNESFSRFGTWNASVIAAGSDAVSGVDVGGWIEFDAPSVEMFVGVSWISLAQARANLATVDPSFDAARAAAAAQWEAVLGTVMAAGPAEPADLTKFYTALYHAHCAPSTLSEAGGAYLGFDGAVHALAPPQQTYFSDMSIWDVYRCTMPLLSLLQPARMGDVAQSIVLISQQGQSLPQWPFVDIYTCAMIGQHAQNILADAYLWGLRNFDVQAAYAAIVKAATTQEVHCARSHADRFRVCVSLGCAFSLAQLATTSWVTFQWISTIAARV